MREAKEGRREGERLRIQKYSRTSFAADMRLFGIINHGIGVLIGAIDVCIIKMLKAREKKKGEEKN